jgi:hypothetical protein
MTGDTGPFRHGDDPVFHVKPVRFRRGGGFSSRG